MSSQPTRILLGITGSIAAYKTPELVRAFIKAGCEVKVVITPSANDFVSELSLATVSKNEVLGNIHNEGQWNNHVELGMWADVFIVAPASANTIAKMAQGICDNLLLACFLSARCKVMIAPAMDLDMYHHAATQNNLNTLRQRGVITIGPASGELASGLIGDGRMEEPSTIVNEVLRSLHVSNSLKNKQVVITAGPTREAIDPVRFISNHSTGKMGVALAEEALQRGANVKLIIGKGALGYTNPNMEISCVDTAEEMLNASLSSFEKADIFIMSAAVADYTPEHVATQKIKKKEGDMSISLKRTPDILATLGSKKKNQLLVGFALETNNELEYAKNKLEKKNLDMIVLNSLQDAGAGFATNTNKISILDNEGNELHFELKTKKMVAIDILNHAEKIMIKKY